MSNHTQDIKDFIQKLPLEEVFVFGQLKHLGSRAAVDKALSRLVSAGFIYRYEPGVYCRSPRRPSCESPGGCGREDCPRGIDCGPDLKFSALKKGIK